jgi:hypothetical protein
MTSKDEKDISRICAQLQDLCVELQEIAEKVRAQFDDLSERAQQGVRGQRLDELASQLEEAVEHLGSAVSCFDSY